MFHVIDSVITWFGAVGSGEEGSPLSANSSLSEILRLLQIAMAAGVIYLIKLLKETKGNSSETHNEIQSQIDDVRKLAEARFQTNNKLILEVKEAVEALETKKEADARTAG